MATSENFRWAPRVPAPSGSQAAMAAGDNQMVMSPRRTRAWDEFSTSSIQSGLSPSKSNTGFVHQRVCRESPVKGDKMP